MRKKPKYLLLLFIVLFVCIAPTAHAITPAGDETLAKEQWAYDPSTECTDQSMQEASTSTLVGSDNIEKAFNYFRGKGLSAEQSAGIIGNLMQESGVNPSSNNKGAATPSIDPGTIIPGETWKGGGIAQWERGRWVGNNGFLNFVAGKGAFAGNKQGDGKNWKVLSIQLDYMWWELNNTEKNALTALRTATTPEDAAEKFERAYERASDPRMENRINNAKKVFSLYSGNATAGTVSQALGCTASAAASGDFVVYNQCDREWGNKPYGSDTICNAGCGPSAMAMIITALTGQRVTPADTSAYAGDRGMYIPGVGSSWDIPKVVAPHWGLNATFIGANMAKINATLNSGGMVILSGQGSLPFSTGGHYIAIRGVTSNGKWLIGDSGHKNTNTLEWNPNAILVNANNGSVYAITKSQ